MPRTEAVLAGSSNPELRRAVSLLLLLLLPATLAASSGKALKQYRAGNYEAARLQYEKLLEKRPDDPRLHFNVGDSAYQAQAYADALRHFQSSLITEDLNLQQQAYYNLGNTAYRIGEKEEDPQKKIGAWEQSLAHYESALKLNPEDQDAQFNHDLVKKILEEFKKQNPEQQQDKNKDEQNKDEQKEESEENKDQKDQDQQQDSKDQKQNQNQDQQPQKDSSEQNKEQQDQEQQQQGDKKDEQKSEEKKTEQQEAQKQDQSQRGEAKDNEEKPDEEGTPAQMIQMTPQQAQRLLDSVKNEERTLIFLPQNLTNRNSRTVKNW